MKNSFTCSCGRRVSTILYENDKKFCKYCKTNSLSGQWERNNASERAKYAKDILQPNSPHFEKAWSKPKNNIVKSKI